jgi:hypothetical protein
MRTLAIALFSMALLFGCKKKEETKPAEPTTETKAPEAAKPAEGTPPAAGTDDAQKYVDLMVNFGKIFAANAKDCTKLAGEIKKYVADNRATFEALKKREAGMTPEQKKAEDEKFKPQMDQFMKDMTPAMESCKTNKDVEAAMKEVPL